MQIRFLMDGYLVASLSPHSDALLYLPATGRVAWLAGSTVEWAVLT